MSFLNCEVLNETLFIENSLFIEDMSDYVLSLTDEDLSLMEDQEIYDMYDFLSEAVGDGFGSRWSNMFINHRQRTEIVPVAKNMQTHHIHKAERIMSDQKKKVVEKGSKERRSALKAFLRAKTKLGKDHPYTKKKEEQLKNTEDVKGNLGVGKSTDKGLTKRFGLLNIGKKGGENENKITKRDKDGNKKTYSGRYTVDITGNSSSGNSNVFETRHNQYNNRAWRAKDRLERYLNGERKHLQRDKDGNVIKGKNGKAKVFYDKYDRFYDPKNPNHKDTGKIVGKAKEYTDKEYTDKHDENISKRVNPARERLLKKSLKTKGLNSSTPTTINPIMIHLNNLGSADDKQYNSKTGKIDKPLHSTLSKTMNIARKYDKDQTFNKFGL